MASASNQVAVDKDGNTPFHKATNLRNADTESLEQFSKLGVDTNQPNHAGRTPLHVLCSKGWYENNPLRGRDIRWMLEYSSTVNTASEVDGVTPLHLASTVSEYLVKVLLLFGADASATTREGLTSLHLASRARQSNVVGMLIYALSQKHGEENLAMHVDAKDQRGWSPLHYACRSGRPESVKLLLDAGGNPALQDGDGMTALDACTLFEEEQELWVDYRRLTPHEGYQLGKVTVRFNYEAAAGLEIQDTLRPFVAKGVAINQYLRRLPTEMIRSDQDTTRLDEILDMILDATKKRGQNTAWILSALNRSLQRSNSMGYAYTVRCLNHFQTVITTGNEEVARQAEEEEDLKVLGRDPLSMGMLERLIQERHYGAMERLFNKGAINPKDEDHMKLLRLLAGQGFARLLSKIPGNSEIKNNPSITGDLLNVACQRTLPNLDVLRVLVETFAIRDDDKTQALSQLAQASHWWQPAQGIPYLLSMSKDDGPEKALLCALRSSDIFAKEASLVLIDGGANISSSSHIGDDIHSTSDEGLDTPKSDDGDDTYSASDDDFSSGWLSDPGSYEDLNALPPVGDGINRRSALELVVCSNYSDDIEVVQRILSAGVPITASAIFLAIEQNAVSVLNLLLQYGANPNLRLDGASNECVAEGWIDTRSGVGASASGFHIRRGQREWYALYHASAQFSLRSEESRIRRAKIMTALVNAGADVYALYRQPLRRPWQENSVFPGWNPGDKQHEAEYVEEENDDDEWSKYDADDAWPPRTKTYGLQSVLHGLLESGFLVEPILSHLALASSLDIEHRSPQGRTLLLSACRSALGADASLNGSFTDYTWNSTTGRYIYDPFTDSDLSNSVLGFLLSREADPEATDVYGKNALHNLLEAHDPMTSFSRPPRIQRSLSDLATQFPQLINRADNNGTYPLHSALQRLRRYTIVNQCGHTAYGEEIIEILLAAGADPQMHDSQGNNALHYLADGLAEKHMADKQRRLFKIFIDRGINVNATNEADLTPLAIMLDDKGVLSEKRDDLYGWAERDGAVIPSEEDIDTEVFGIFEKANAKWDRKDKEGRTLLDIVVQSKLKRAAWRRDFLIGKGVALTS